MTLEEIKAEIDKLSAEELEVIRRYVADRQALSREVIGIVGDMHGDYESFNTALEFFDEQGITRVLCPGDIVDRGPDADKIIKVIQERGIACIAGNHDRTVVSNQARWRQSDNPERLKELGRIVSDETVAFLKALPDTAEFVIAGQRILMGHGTPYSDVVGVFPDTRQATFERLYDQYVEDYDILILGHTHQPMHAMVKGLHILNAGSIYSVTMRDSHTFATLSLPDCTFTVYDVETCKPIEINLTQR